jgi:hypothetical protein
MDLIPVMFRHKFSNIIYFTLSHRNKDGMGNVFYFYSMNTSIDKNNLSGVLPCTRRITGGWIISMNVISGEIRRRDLRYQQGYLHHERGLLEIPG